MSMKLTTRIFQGVVEEPVHLLDLLVLLGDGRLHTGGLELGFPGGAPVDEEGGVSSVVHDEIGS
jgi:hypothetical protein